jgi:hypothetical protein
MSPTTTHHEIHEISRAELSFVLSLYRLESSLQKRIVEFYLINLRQFLIIIYVLDKFSFYIII